MNTITEALTEGPSASNDLSVREFINTPRTLIAQILMGHVSESLPATDYGLRSLTSALVPTADAINLTNIITALSKAPVLHQVEFMRALLLHAGPTSKGFITANSTFTSWCSVNYRLVMGCDFSA